MQVRNPRLSDIIGMFLSENELPLVLVGPWGGHPSPYNNPDILPHSIYERLEHPRGASFGFVSNRRRRVVLYRTWFGHVADAWISIDDPDFLDKLLIELQWMLSVPKSKRIGPNAGR